MAPALKLIMYSGFTFPSVAIDPLREAAKDSRPMPLKKRRQPGHHVGGVDEVADMQRQRVKKLVEAGPEARHDEQEQAETPVAQSHGLQEPVLRVACAAFQDKIITEIQQHPCSRNGPDVHPGKRTVGGVFGTQHQKSEQTEHKQEKPAVAQHFHHIGQYLVQRTRGWQIYFPR
jgi:hypothetical protein